MKQKKVNTMETELCLQIASDASDIPTEEQMQQWLSAALAEKPGAVLTVRIVDEAESAALNEQFRGKIGPTNVLSFPADLPAEVDLPLLGDIVICAPLVHSEASAQNKPLQAHWAHLLVHGTLHLLGFDHLQDEEAKQMEALEVRLLDQLGFADPYA
jgi:probable rRNA maturation factor